MMQGWYYVESLTGQWHDRVQTESQIATVDSCFDLIGSLQHGVASCELCSWLTDIHKPTKMQMVMTPDETQIQILANWPMSHAKRVTRDNRKNPEHRVIAAIRKLRTEKLSRRRIMAKPCQKWAAYRIWKDLRPQKFPIVPCHAFCMWHWPIGKNLDLGFIWGHRHLHFSGSVNISQPAAYFTARYTVPKRPYKVETAVHGCNLAFSLDSIVSLPR